MGLNPNAYVRLFNVDFPDVTAFEAYFRDSCHFKDFLVVHARSGNNLML